MTFIFSPSASFRTSSISCSDVGYATASGKCFIAPIRIPTQSGKLWPCACSKRSFKWVDISGCDDFIRECGIEDKAFSIVYSGAGFVSPTSSFSKICDDGVSGIGVS